jgi:hypothetical protein
MGINWMKKVEIFHGRVENAYKNEKETYAFIYIKKLRKVYMERTRNHEYGEENKV